MIRPRKAKIVATLGPATSDLDTITQLFNAGADVFRLNFSHGSHEDHKRRYDMVREV
ncbi:pyruvate kinase, partial [Caballeronia mineralivorans]